MADVSGMSVRDMKEELASLGESASGCVERSEIEARLLSVRQRGRDQGAPQAGPAGGRQGGGGGGAAANPAASMAFALQGVFDSVGGSFNGVMNKLTTKFDDLDARLDGLEAKRQQVKDRIDSKQPTTPLGRLNQLKAEAGAAELREKLRETRKETYEGKKELAGKVQKESASMMQGMA
eukprot:CAMPEP_0114163726 /NCGR_PEP_ID=MMETSP0043_2-20121206/30248_1 /TAXON_ID=464988 /ORGANISM="Hemiselmis andersenii, Strain CCMP644" /LENGTH=178 /DNA_ID=CAMNT_0001260259 /DNA_START=1 /DNA_END=533 /DNA_ORIENTATION=+